MANQTITTNKNHDELTARLAGEDITIQLGAKLTIDSMPHLTPSGILGDILITSGEVHIDGTKVRETAYTSGSGTMPTAIPTAISWTGGTGKIIRYNSGNNTAGTITLTVLTGVNPTGTITDGTWSATVSTDKVGYLIIYGEDQVWDATDATCTMRITGDWYELGTGTGADNQSFTLPVAGGWQHAIWVETGSGTGVYEIWHRVLQNGVNGAATSAVFWDAVTDWGNSFETGFVFYNDRSAGTITVGTSTNGGVIPNGAKVRIPNVHIGTTTTGAPTTEYVGVAIASTLEILDGSVTENVFIDHLNASTAQCSLVQTNGGTISDSAIGWINATNEINRCNAAVSIKNCAYISGTGLTGDSQTAGFIIQDNVGGITIEDCVFYGGVNGTNSRGLTLLTMANILFKGRNKVPSNQQDENSHYAVGGSVASNVIFEGDLILNSAGVATLAGCVNWEIENIIWSQNTARGTTEDAMVLLNFTGSDTIVVQGGRFAIGSGVRHMAGGLISITDCANITIRNFGAVDAKIACGGRGTYILSLAGITNNCLFQRLYFSGRNTALPFTMVNSCADITIENCSGDYDDELEAMSNRVLMKGVHGASGNIGATTGWEDDYVNVLASIFNDCFKSDTTGGVTLLFNDRGEKHLGDVSIDAGTPIFNGIGDLLMTALNDQITYSFPYWIKGHTGFTATLPHLLGVNCGTLGSGWGNFTIEYDLDSGSGYSGSFKTASTANLTGETISSSGFRIKIRIRCTTASATNAIRGLQIHTSTTIADQKANLYPLETVNLAVTVKDNAGNNIENAQVAIYNATTLAELMNKDTNASGVATTSYEYAGNTSIVVRIRKSSSGVTKYVSYGGLGTITSTGFSTTIALDEDSLVDETVNSTINGDWTIDTTNKTIKHTADSVVYTVNELYTWLMDTFDESGYMDDANPMTVQTPTEYTLKNSWFIDNNSLHYLSRGAIQTEGQGSYNIHILTVTGGTYSDPVSGDITKTVVAGATSIGPLLDYEIISAGVSSKWYVRDTRTTPAQIDSTTAMTISSGTGSGNNSTNSLSGENLWSNVYTLGSLVSGTTFDIYQNDVQLTPWWSTGQIDVLVKVMEAGVEIDSSNLTILARKYSTLYDHYIIDASSGRNPVPIAAFSDANNTTIEGTVSGYNDITINFGAASEDIGNGNGARPYDVSINCAGRTLKQTYEYLKYVTRTESAATLNGVSGEFYIAVGDIRLNYTNETSGPFVQTSAITSSSGGSGHIVSLIDNGTTGTLVIRNIHGTFLDTDTLTSGSTTATIDGVPDIISPSKQAPFGTYAGGKFFGARGVFVENMAGGDVVNYQLTDSTNTIQSPPNTVSTIITVQDLATASVIEGATVLVWVTDDSNYFYGASVSITGSGTTATVGHTNHGLTNGDFVIIEGVTNDDDYNGVYEVTVTGDNQYTYTTTETLGTSPATGTITSTFALISGTTNASGIISDVRNLSVNQPVSGWVRKSSSSPYYQQGTISGTVNSTTGLSLTVQLAQDE